MKNRNRIQILKQIVSQSNYIMDDLFQLTMQIYETPPRQNMQMFETTLCDQLSSSSDSKTTENYRNTLLEQFADSLSKKSAN